MIYTLKNIQNIRDLGGMKTKDGKKIKKNLLFRSGELSNIDDGDISFLKKNNIKAVVDFRDLSECKIHKDIKVPKIDYYSLPAIPPINMPEDPKERERFLAEWNKKPLEIFKDLYKNLATSKESISAYKKFFEILLSLNGSAILWHCMQGKDRTGIASILLLTALGVPKEDALKEYFLTNDFMEKEYQKLIDSKISKEKLEIMKIVLFVREDCIKIYIDEIENTYGSLSCYIEKVLNITKEKIDLLRDMYLE